MEKTYKTIEDFQDLEIEVGNNTIYVPAKSFLMHEKMERLYEILESVEDHVSEWYSECDSVSEVLEKSEDEAAELLDSFCESVANEFIQNGILDYNKEDYGNHFLSGLSDFVDAVNELGEKLAEITDDEEAKIAYRKARKEGRGRYVGWGQGMDGAIRASVDAGMLNAGTGLAHSAFNAVMNVGTRLKSLAKQSALYEDEDTCEALASAASDSFFSIFDEYLSLYNKLILGDDDDVALLSLSDFNEITDRQEKKLENMEKANLNESQKCQLLCDILNEWPFSEDAWEMLIQSPAFDILADKTVLPFVMENIEMTDELRESIVSSMVRDVFDKYLASVKSDDSKGRKELAAMLNELNNTSDQMVLAQLGETLKAFAADTESEEGFFKFQNMMLLVSDMGFQSSNLFDDKEDFDAIRLMTVPYTKEYMDKDSSLIAKFDKRDIKGIAEFVKGQNLLDPQTVLDKIEHHVSSLADKGLLENAFSDVRSLTDALNNGMKKAAKVNLFSSEEYRKFAAQNDPLEIARRKASEYSQEIELARTARLKNIKEEYRAFRFNFHGIKNAQEFACKDYQFYSMDSFFEKLGHKLDCKKYYNELSGKYGTFENAIRQYENGRKSAFCLYKEEAEAYCKQYSADLLQLGLPFIIIGKYETAPENVSCGFFPQSLKDASVSIDKSQCMQVGEKEYYMGSDNFWYAQEGQEFRKVEPLLWKQSWNNGNYAYMTSFECDEKKSFPMDKSMTREIKKLRKEVKDLMD